MAGLCAPLSTLRQHLRRCRRMTRGQCGSLDLHCERLALSTPCRSSRRTRSQDLCTGSVGDGSVVVPCPVEVLEGLLFELLGDSCPLDDPNIYPMIAPRR